MYKRINELLGTNYKSDRDIDWLNIIRGGYKLSEEFIEEFENELDWNILSSCHKLSENIIRKHINRIKWSYITSFQSLSEEFILEFKDKFNSTILSTCQVLSENFIRNNQDIIDWNLVSECQILSEEFIDEFKDYLNWKCIAESQPFIDPNHYTVLNFRSEYEDKNILNIIYQKTKERGWFLGVLKEESYNPNFNFIYLGETIIGENYIKARIYWRDLIKTNAAKYYEPIRLIKGV